jgi:hypothetical protein
VLIVNAAERATVYATHEIVGGSVGIVLAVLAVDSASERSDDGRVDKAGQNQLAALVGVALAAAGGADGNLALNGAGTALNGALRTLAGFNGTEGAHAAADITLDTHVGDVHSNGLLATFIEGNIDGADGAVLFADATLLAEVCVDFVHFFLSFKLSMIMRLLFVFITIIKILHPDSFFKYIYCIKRHFSI